MQTRRRPAHCSTSSPAPSRPARSWRTRIRYCALIKCSVIITSALQALRSELRTKDTKLAGLADQQEKTSRQLETAQVAVRRLEGEQDTVAATPG